MGGPFGKFGFGRSSDDGDLERLREVALDHASDEVRGSDSSSEASASGNTFNNYGASTSAVLLVAAIAALALGMAVVNSMHRYNVETDWSIRFDQAEKAWQVRYEQQERSWQNRFEMQLQQYREAQTQSKLTERRLIDIETYAMLNGWKVPKDDQHGPLGNVERMKDSKHVR